MNGNSKALKELTERAKQKGADDSQSDDLLPPDSESWEEPTGDGRTSKHQVFGLQLIDGKKVIGGCPYGAIVGWNGEYNGTSFTFWYLLGDKLMEATITGSISLQSIVDKLTSGKRESCRVNGSTITSIVIREVKTKPA